MKIAGFLLGCVHTFLTDAHGSSDRSNVYATFLGHDLHKQATLPSEVADINAPQQYAAQLHASQLSANYRGDNPINLVQTFAEGQVALSFGTTRGPEFAPWNKWALIVGWALVLVAGFGVQLWDSAQSPQGITSFTSCATSKGSQPLMTVLKENLLPASTVTLVSIPLSMALGIASGAGPVTGLITAVVSGGVAGFFSSSAFNIVGPAGALAGLLMRYSMIYGPEILPWLSLVSAIIVFVVTALKLHVYCMFMPKCVFEGFTLGVALTIGLGQLDAGFGLTAGPPPHVHSIHLSPITMKLAASCQALHTIQLSSTLLFVIGTLGMLLLFKWKPSIPWPVPFAMLTLLLGALCDPEAFGVIPVSLSTLRMRYGFLEPSFANPLVPLWDLVENAEVNGGGYGDFMVGAMSVSLVAILETLISAKIAAVKAGMDFDVETELWGLGLAHIACGICGAMPPTGVFVRTSVNLRTGATHKTSQAVHALFIAIVLGLCIRVCSFIPEAAVAAILVVSAMRMAPVEYIASVWQNARHAFSLLLVVAVLCLVIDSVVGLAVGTIVGLLWVAKETAQGHAEVSVSTRGGKMNMNADGTPQMKTIDALKMDRLGRSPRSGQNSARSATDRSRASIVFDEVPFLTTTVAKAPIRTRASFLSYATRDHESPLHTPRFEEIQAEKSAQIGDVLSERGDRVYLYRFLGQVSYLNGEKHMERISTILQAWPKAIVLDLCHVAWIDTDGLDAFEQILLEIKMAKVKVFLSAARPLVQEVLDVYMDGAWKELLDTSQVLPSVSMGLKAAFAVKGSSAPEEESGLDDDDDDDEEWDPAQDDDDKDKTTTQGADAA